MLKSSFKFCLFATFGFLIACGSAPKKEVYTPPVIETVADKSLQTAPVLTEPDKQAFLNAVADLKAEAWDDAQKGFESLLDRYPNLAGAYVNLGLIRKAKEEDEAAISLFNKALSYNPKNISAMIQLSGIAQKQGRFLDAESYLKQAYDVKPNSSVVNYNLGVLYELYLQSYSKAVKHYQNYVNLGQGDDIEVVKRWIKLLERK